MVFAALGIFMLAISIRNDRANRDGPESIEVTQESE